MHDVPDDPQVMMARMMLCNKFQGNDKSPAIQYKGLLAPKSSRPRRPVARRMSTNNSPILGSC